MKGQAPETALSDESTPYPPIEPASLYLLRTLNDISFVIGCCSFVESKCENEAKAVTKVVLDTLTDHMKYAFKSSALDDVVKHNIYCLADKSGHTRARELIMNTHSGNFGDDGQGKNGLEQKPSKENKQAPSVSCQRRCPPPSNTTVSSSPPAVFDPSTNCRDESTELDSEEDGLQYENALCDENVGEEEEEDNDAYPCQDVSVTAETDHDDEEADEEGGNLCCDIMYLADMEHSRCVNDEFAAHLQDECDNQSLWRPGAKLVLSVGICDPFSPYFAVANRLALGTCSMASVESIGVQFASVLRGKMIVSAEAKRITCEQICEEIDAEHSSINVCLPISYTLHRFDDANDECEGSCVTSVESYIEQEAKMAVRRFREVCADGTDDDDNGSDNDTWRVLSKLQSEGMATNPRISACSRIAHDVSAIRVYRSITFHQLCAKCGRTRVKSAKSLVDLGISMHPDVEDIGSHTLDWWHESVIVPALANVDTFWDALDASRFLSSQLCSGNMNAEFEAAERIPFDVVSDNYAPGVDDNVDFKRFFSAEDAAGKATTISNERKRRAIRGIIQPCLAIHSARTLVAYGMARETVPEFIYALLTASPTSFNRSKFNFMMDKKFYMGEADAKSTDKTMKTVDKAISVSSVARKELQTTALYTDITRDVRDQESNVFDTTCSYFEHLRAPNDDPSDSGDEDVNAGVCAAV